MFSKAFHRASIAVAAAVYFLFLLAGNAQITKATLNGVVTDVSGASIVNADVTVTTDPALNECHISGFHTSKFVWIQPMAGS
jgi:hypothetical protein